MGNKEITYVFSLSGDGDWDECPEEVLQYAYDGGRIFDETVEITRGEILAQTHADFVSGNSILELIAEQAYEVHDDFADLYLAEILNNGRKKAEFNALIVDWLNENATQPTFYQIIKTKEITMPVPSEFQQDRELIQ